MSRNDSEGIDFPVLWEYVESQCHFGMYSVHGPAHWRRVEQNGLLLCERTGADPTEVRLFALFHDCRRENECTDHGHGARGAEYAALLRDELFLIDDQRFELLCCAGRGHTEEISSNNPTVGTCWDADRLDLGRVGIIPDEAFMSTAFGKEIARVGSIFPFLKESGNLPGPA